MHDGDTNEMKWTMRGLNVEIQYIEESKHLTEEEKKSAIEKYKEVIKALRKIIYGEETND
jgi:hypothetical protein